MVWQLDKNFASSSADFSFVFSFLSGYREGACLRGLTSMYMEKKEVWSTVGLARSPKVRVTTSSVIFHYTPSSRSEHPSP